MTTLETALKDTADRAMHYAAARCNRVRSLKALADSGRLTDNEFFHIIGQSPCTIGRDLAWADDDYDKAKHHYEAVCRVLGVPAYATWNDD